MVTGGLLWQWIGEHLPGCGGGEGLGVRADFYFGSLRLSVDINLLHSLALLSFLNTAISVGPVLPILYFTDHQGWSFVGSLRQSSEVGPGRRHLGTCFYLGGLVGIRRWSLGGQEC